MDKIQELEALVKDIVRQAKRLKDKYTQEQNAPVNYSAVFCRTQNEYGELVKVAKGMGRVVDDTPTGPVFQIKTISTVSGELKLLKIRAPDQTRPERGDADFTVRDYGLLKAACLRRPEFKLIERENFEMIELSTNSFNVRAYFSNPPLDKQLGI